VLFSCSSLEQFMASMNTAMNSLSPDTRTRMLAIVMKYYGWHGFNGTYQRLNNRTIAHIFADFQTEDAKPIAAGELDGVRYELHDGGPSGPVDNAS
jgi:hypothetical protein